MDIKRYFAMALAMIIALVLTLSMYSCNDGNDGDNTPPDNDPGASNGGDNKDEEIEGNKPQAKDGLSEDKTYYQLTNKDGRVIRIPIGVPLSAAENGTISSASSEAKSTSKRMSLTSKKAEPIDETESKSIHVFSPLSIISFGYGDIKNPAKSGYLNESEGVPFSVDEDHILVVQCLDIELNVVEPTNDNAYYIYAYVLDYKTNPDGLMFSKIIEYSANEDRLINYFTFSNIVFGTPYTSTSVTTQTDPYTGEITKIYYKAEEVTIRFPGLIKIVPLKEYFCNSDWSVKYWYEYTYDSDFNLIMDVHYDCEDRITFKRLYDENGNEAEIYSYEYYDNGQIKSISEPDYYAFYDENGELIESATRVESSPGNYIWYSTYDDPFLGISGRLERIFENDILTKEIYYYGDSNAIWEIYYINVNGRWDVTECYYEDGTLCVRTRYEYIDDTYYYTYSTVYTEEGVIDNETEYYYESGYPLTQKEKYYKDGVFTYIFHHEFYPENGGLKILRWCDTNDNLIVETHYDEDGNVIKEIRP